MCFIQSSILHDVLCIQTGWLYPFLTYSFPNLEPVVPYTVLTIAPCPEYRFLRRHKVFLYSCLFNNFPQFVVIHTVKGFSVVSEADIDVFLEFSCIFYDPMDVSNLISGSSAFSNPPWKTGCFRFMYCWSQAWRILSITLLACEMRTLVW